MTCKAVEGSHVAPGWGCCACRKRNGAGIYNGEARSVCKVCGHERCDVGEMREDKVSDFLGQQNPEEVLAVLRPKDPKLAVKVARKIAKKQQRRTITAGEANRQFQAMLGQQEYRFVGILDKKKPPRKGVAPNVLDPRTGLPIDRLQLGDSFVPYHVLKAAAPS